MGDKREPPPHGLRALEHEPPDYHIVGKSGVRVMVYNLDALSGPECQELYEALYEVIGHWKGS